MTADSKAEGKKQEFGPVVAVLAIGVFLWINFADKISFLRDGPKKVFSMGYARLANCSYKGNFVGGVGFDCVLKNYSSGLRHSLMYCANFDGSGRMLGSPDMVGAAWDIVLQPAEERVVRVYFDKDAVRGVCSDVKDSIPSLNSLDANKEEWRGNNLGHDVNFD